ncbi:XTP/dITP diphosphatase [Planococcus sp. APC 3906]|uniref:XTP/dITP diphosphatase n=1 Tax=Planococcus sp. APC 3906 TaxID=3035194 RepID=UPI0025B40BB3|nr:XTP/dITP diphosphatase [Planococcus sp. APC 3906]MDN3449143.1 XTP/dITP diphosphatase [Planococcus sp. APC 3906]
MKQVIIATQNLGKAKDFEALFRPFGYEVLTLRDIAEEIDVEETGSTFEENAILKAETVAKLLNTAVIADDSGLEIDALGGEPGVYSARYAGGEKSDSANIDKVLEKMKGIPEEKRHARFRCVLAIAVPGKETKVFSGACEGYIIEERIGENGFGYDPIFWVPSEGRTLAEMQPQEKAAISHRGNAMREMQQSLSKLLNGFEE